MTNSNSIRKVHGIDCLFSESKDCATCEANPNIKQPSQHRCPEKENRMTPDTNPINTNDRLSTVHKKCRECRHLYVCLRHGGAMPCYGLKKFEVRICQWYEIEDDCWQTECGHYSPLFHTTWNFCPYCGKSIKQVTSPINTDN